MVKEGVGGGSGCFVCASMGGEGFERSTATVKPAERVRVEHKLCNIISSLLQHP